MCETVTTCMLRACKNRRTSGSCLMSSSRVTRYCTFPTTAVSRMRSSSGSRQIVTVPVRGTRMARAAMSSQYFAMSVSGMRYFRLIRGRRRTSCTSASSGREATTSTLPANQASTNCAGAPTGLSNADIQTLESNSAAGCTSFGSDFSAGNCDVCFDRLRRRASGALVSPFQ